MPWWLGLSYKGISQYDFNDKKTPRRVWTRILLPDIYFSRKCSKGVTNINTNVFILDTLSHLSECTERVHVEWSLV